MTVFTVALRHRDVPSERLITRQYPTDQAVDR